jgi:hypothetical protein
MASQAELEQAVGLDLGEIAKRIQEQE